METDQLGQIILSENDICKWYMSNPEGKITPSLIEDAIQFHADLELENIPQLTVWRNSNLSIEEWDKINQSNWRMPQEYIELDIAKWVLDQCKTDAERQRVGEELLMYLDRDLFPLLQYLKYLVDTMRTNGIVWGVGRGSSVSSYVLYLIGVHRIDSMYWDLDISEFLR